MIVTAKNDFDAVFRPMGKAVSKEDQARAARLKRLRAYRGYGDSGPRFAAFIGISYARYNNFERGYPLTQDMAVTIARKCPGVTPDWILWGYLGNLSVSAAAGLGELPAGSGKSKISAD